MSCSITVCHGDFGRLCYTELNRAKVMHATRSGQLLFLISGEDVTININGESIVLATDKAVAIDSFSAYDIPEVESSKSSENRAVIMSIYIDPHWYGNRCAKDADPEWLSFRVHSIEIDAEIQEHVDHLRSLVHPPAPTKEPGYFATLESRLCQLCRACFSQPSEQNEAPSVPANPLTTCDSRIRRSLSIMNDHVRSDLCLDEIAREAGLSRPHFYRLFRDNLGFTPNIYMNLLRMEFAVERLTFSDQPVTSIAQDLGFASQASFTRFFGANQGIPPTDYRRLACLPPSSPPTEPNSAHAAGFTGTVDGAMQPPTARSA